MQVLSALLACCGVQAARLRRGYRAYVKEATRRAADITYHFDNLDLSAAAVVVGTAAPVWCQSRPLETPPPATGSHGSHHDHELDVSTMSLCAWYSNATINPCRVCLVPYAYSCCCLFGIYDRTDNKIR